MGHQDECRLACGSRGAIAAANAHAVAAGEQVFTLGGNCVDAAIAAQAAICVTMPHAAGLGGDMLALVRQHSGVVAFNGAGRTPRIRPSTYQTDGGSSVTVPGLVDGWLSLHEQYGSLSLGIVLSSAIQLASDGVRVDASLARAVDAQRSRLVAYGGGQWSLLDKRVGDLWRQPELSSLLSNIVQHGRAAFYSGDAARQLTAAAAAYSGTMSADDLSAHSTQVCAPIETPWSGGVLRVQPPSTQGVLLAMAARWLDEADASSGEALQHAMVEVTEAAFAFRDSVFRGQDLLSEHLDVDLECAAHRGGPRSYLHTAGVATADASGLVVSSLVSVFDDFGSGVFVPELGIVLNNRAGGFTSGSNSPGPSKRPVHTLAPAIVQTPSGGVLALATPGADGQVQTLLQILARTRFFSEDLEHAIAAPRWRSQDGYLLIEDDHESVGHLAERGHRIQLRPAGDDIFGAVVAAGMSANGPFGAADWRRDVKTGAI